MKHMLLVISCAAVLFFKKLQCPHAFDMVTSATLSLARVLTNDQHSCSHDHYGPPDPTLPTIHACVCLFSPGTWNICTTLLGDVDYITRGCRLLGDACSHLALGTYACIFMPNPHFHHSDLAHHPLPCLAPILECLSCLLCRFAYSSSCKCVNM